MTPMSLERAVEVAIECCDEAGSLYEAGHAYGDELEQAAAMLRAAMPFIKAAVEAVEQKGDPAPWWTEADQKVLVERLRAMRLAYRAMKEGE